MATYPSTTNSNLNFYGVDPIAEYLENQRLRDLVNATNFTDATVPTVSKKKGGTLDYAPDIGSGYLPYSESEKINAAFRNTMADDPYYGELIRRGIYIPLSDEAKAVMSGYQTVQNTAGTQTQGLTRKNATGTVVGTGTGTGTVVGTGTGTGTVVNTKPTTSIGALDTKPVTSLTADQTALSKQNEDFLKNWQSSADALKTDILTGVDIKNQQFGTQATQGFMDAFKNFQIPTNQQTGVNLGNYNDNRNAAADQWWSQYVTGRR